MLMHAQYQKEYLVDYLTQLWKYNMLQLKNRTPEMLLRQANTVAYSAMVLMITDHYGRFKDEFNLAERRRTILAKRCKGPPFRAMLPHEWEPVLMEFISIEKQLKELL